MGENISSDLNLEDHDVIFYSLLYTSTTILFAMAVLSKFLTNEFRFGFRSILSLTILFIGEPLCQTFVKGTAGLALFGFGCLFVYSILPASHLSGKGKAVLITGMIDVNTLCILKRALIFTFYCQWILSDHHWNMYSCGFCTEKLSKSQIDIGLQQVLAYRFAHRLRYRIWTCTGEEARQQRSSCLRRLSVQEWSGWNWSAK